MSFEPESKISILTESELATSVGSQEFPDDFDASRHEYAKGVEAGVTLLSNRITELLEKQKQIVVALAGLTGSGKTTIANSLRSMLAELQGIDATIISTDAFISKDSHTPDIERLHVTLGQLKKGETVGSLTPAKVLIIEGLQTIADTTLGQKPDIRAYVAVPAEKRFAARLLRDDKNGFRSLRDSLQILADMDITTLQAVQQFEAPPSLEDIDIIINNDRDNLDDPKLYIDGDTIVFISPQGLETISISPEKIPMLEKIGILRMDSR